MAKYTCPTCHTEEISIAVYIPVSVTWSAWVLPDTGQLLDGRLDREGTPSQAPEEVEVMCVECETFFRAEVERNVWGFPARVLSLEPMPR